MNTFGITIVSTMVSASIIATIITGVAVLVILGNAIIGTYDKNICKSLDKEFKDGK